MRPYLPKAGSRAQAPHDPAPYSGDTVPEQTHHPGQPGLGPVTPSAPRGAVTVDPAVLRVGPHGQEGRVAEAECAQAPNLPTGVSTLAGVRGPGCSGLSF